MVAERSVGRKADADETRNRAGSGCPERDVVHMNAQFKKGVLELIVLESVRQRDMYGYELVEEVSKVVDVNEGTIYPLLKRLTNERYFETYLRESTEGPPRKYYHLTAAGVLYRDSLENEWNQLAEKVAAFLEGCHDG